MSAPLGVLEILQGRRSWRVGSEKQSAARLVVILQRRLAPKIANPDGTKGLHLQVVGLEHLTV